MRFHFLHITLSRHLKMNDTPWWQGMLKGASQTLDSSGSRFLESVYVTKIP